jgi:hypothetical protein
LNRRSGPRKEFRSLPDLISDVAYRKRRAAQARFAGTLPGQDSPRDVYFAGCASIGSLLLYVYAHVQAEREGDVLAVSFRQYPSATPDSVSLLLRWDYVASGPLGPDQASIKLWLNDAHDFSGRLFRASLTEKCEQLFEPKSDPNEHDSRTAE